MTSWGGYKEAPRPQVYRVFDKTGRLIYIGASRSVAARFHVHESLTWWHGLIDRIETVDYPTMQAAFAAEAVAIQEEQPAFNVRGTTDGPYLTPADVDEALRWRDAAPGRYLGGLNLVLRINEVRRAAAQAA